MKFVVGQKVKFYFSKIVVESILEKYHMEPYFIITKATDGGLSRNNTYELKDKDGNVVVCPWNEDETLTFIEEELKLPQ